MATALQQLLGYNPYGTDDTDQTSALRRTLGYDDSAANNYAANGGGNTLSGLATNSTGLQSQYTAPDQSGIDYANADSVDLINRLYDQSSASQISALDSQYAPMRDQAIVDARNNMRAIMEGAANRGDVGGMARQDALGARLAGENAVIDLDRQKSAAAAAIRSDSDAARLRDIIAAKSAQQTRADTLKAQADEAARQEQARQDALAQQTIENQNTAQARQDTLDQQTVQNNANEQARQDALAQQAIQNAWARVQAQGGYVDATSAPILGLKEGTKLSGYSSGGSGGSSRASLSDEEKAKLVAEEIAKERATKSAQYQAARNQVASTQRSVVQNRLMS